MDEEAPPSQGLSHGSAGGETRHAASHTSSSVTPFVTTNHLQTLLFKHPPDLCDIGRLAADVLPPFYAV